ncbi:MAG TPA: GNAT family N-acetyltransferase [Burkholderiales bacterium]|nr:GNAT family N-acetyltransferase [Burkholderiales bacterium]
MASTELPLTDADIPAAEALVAEAGWNQNAADWRIFLELGRAFAVKDAGRLAATAATLPYPSGFGWISMVLVAGPFRRRGVATRLLRRCIEVLRESGMVPVLDATPAGREVYKPLGFRDGWAITRWRRTAVTSETKNRNEEHGVRPHLLEERHWPAVLALDAQAFGCDRAPLLERLRRRSSGFSCVVEEHGGLRGFLLGREGRIATHLGPIVAEDEAAAAELAGFACARIAGQVIVDALDRHAPLARWLEDHGFSRERPYTRMALGRNDLFGDPRRLAAIAGPELG